MNIILYAILIDTETRGLSIGGVWKPTKNEL